MGVMKGLRGNPPVGPEYGHVDFTVTEQRQDTPSTALKKPLGVQVGL